MRPGDITHRSTVHEAAWGSGAIGLQFKFKAWGSKFTTLVAWAMRLTAAYVIPYWITLVLFLAMADISIGPKALKGMFKIPSSLVL